MQEQDRVLTAALAGLLHDIGKFAWNRQHRRRQTT